jgi:serine/threonine-protein kinase
LNLGPDTLFHSRYEIKGPLGRGGMGMVYRAHDRTLDEMVAIKILRPDFALDPRMAERFKSEIKLARRVRHRNVCAIHDYGEDKGLLYISMELVEGMDLKSLLREKGALPPYEAYEVAIQAAEGLQAVHEAGIIHRDLKTPNIMRDAQGVARLMDFGVAKRHGAQGTPTLTGHVLGTAEYMSPEQAHGEKVDFRTDIYSLGVVIYEVFTGQVPFRGETPLSTILKHLHDPPPLDGPRAAALPPSLKPVLHKALAKEPAYRYPTAAALAEALRQARAPGRHARLADTEVLEAPTLERAPREAPLLRHHRRAWLGIVGGMAVAVTVASLQRQRGAHEPVTAPTAAPAASAPTPPAGGPIAAVPPATTPAETAPAPPANPATPVPAPEAGSRSIVLAPAAPRAEPPDPRRTGLLLVVARPWGRVRVDGRDVGKTPLETIPLRPGVHAVVIEHPSYEPIEREVTIRAGRTERLVVDFAEEGSGKRP